MRRTNQIQEHIHYHYHYTCTEDPLPKSGRDSRKRTSGFDYYTPQSCKNGNLSSRSTLYQSIIVQETLPISRNSLDMTSKSDARLASNAKSASPRQKYFVADRTRDPSQMMAEDDNNEDHLMTRSNIRSDVSFEVKVQNPEHIWKAQYEKEIQDLKKQVARLQSVEEECIYLRDKYLNHYQKVCKGKK